MAIALALYSPENLPHLLQANREKNACPDYHCIRCGLEWRWHNGYRYTEAGYAISDETGESEWIADHPVIGSQIWDPCKPRTWYVNTYEMDREYGGPEEGGWYFDSWRAVECITVDTYGYGEMLRTRLYDGYEKPLRDRYSVIYSGGDLQFRLEEKIAEDGNSYRPWC